MHGAGRMAKGPRSNLEFSQAGCRPSRCGTVLLMSERNGDKARFQKNRKRVVLRRAKARMLAAAGSNPEKAPEKARRTQG